MAVAFRAAGSANTGAAAAASLSVPIPTGTLAGDLVVVGLSWNGTGTINTPTGWNKVTEVAQSTNFKSAMYWRVNQVGDLAPSFALASGTANMSANACSYSGADATNPIAGFASSSAAAATTFGHPAVLPETDTPFFVFHLGGRNTVGTASITASATGLVERADTTNTATAWIMSAMEDSNGVPTSYSKLSSYGNSTCSRSSTQAHVGIAIREALETTNVDIEQLFQKRSTTGGTVTLSAFTTLFANRLMIAVASSTSRTGRITVSGAGLTWSRVAQSRGAASGGMIEIWMAYATSVLSAQTITAAHSSAAGSVNLQVYSIRNASTAKLVGQTNNMMGSGTPWSTNLVTTVANSMVMGAVGMGSATSINVTSAGDIGMLDDYDNIGNFATNFFRGGIVATAGTTETISGTNNGVGEWSAALVEIVPSGGSFKVFPNDETITVSEVNDSMNYNNVFTGNFASTASPSLTVPVPTNMVDPIAIVFAHLESNVNVTALSLGGTAGVAQNNSASVPTASGGYVINPPSGSQTLSLTLSAASAGGVTVVFFDGAAQTSPITQSPSGSGSSSSATGAPTTDPFGFSLTAITTSLNNAFTPNTDDTEVADFATQNNNRAYVGYQKNTTPVSAAVTTGASFTSSAFGRSSMSVKPSGRRASVYIPTPTGPSPLNVDKSDSITVTEAIQVTLDPLSVNVSDTVTISENVQVSTIVPPPPDLNVSKSETITVSEAITVTTSAPQIATADTVTVSENVQVQISTPQVNVSDTVTVSEALNDTLAHNTSIAELLYPIHEFVDVNVRNRVSRRQFRHAYPGGTSMNLAYNSNVAAGSLLVVMVSWGTGSVAGDATVTDSLGTTYTRQDTVRASANYTQLQVFYGWVPGGGGANTVSASVNQGTDIGMTIIEYVGAVNDSTFRVHSDRAAGQNANVRLNLTGYRGGMLVGFYANETSGTADPNMAVTGMTEFQWDGSHLDGQADQQIGLTVAPQTTYTVGYDISPTYNNQAYIGLSFGNAVMDVPSARDEIKVSENVSVAVVSGSLPPLAVSVSDTITVSEVVQRMLEGFIAVSETITVIDSLPPPVIQLYISVSETITVTENLINAQLISMVRASDTVTVTENVVLQNVLQVRASDSITISEAIGRLLVSNVSVSDTVSVAEALNFRIDNFATVSDLITVSESVALQIQSYVRITDTITVSENVAVALPDALKVHVTDTITVTEFHDEEHVIPASVSDTITVSEAISVKVSDPRVVVSDTIIVTEGVNVIRVNPDEPNAIATDTITVSENVRLQTNANGVTSDTISVSENVAVQVQQAAPREVSVADTVTVSESVVGAIAHNVKASETINVTENVQAQVALNLRVQDNVTVTEAVEVFTKPPLLVSVSDSIVVTEAVALFITLTADETVEPRIKQPRQQFKIRVRKDRQGKGHIRKDRPRIKGVEDA